MLSQAQPNLVIVFGIIAFLLGVFWGVGIHRAAQKKWHILGRAVMMTILIPALVFGFDLGKEFLSITTTDTWFIAAIIFVVTFVFNLIVMPRLEKRFGANLVDTLVFVGTFVLLGIGAIRYGISDHMLSSGTAGTMVAAGAFLCIIGGLAGLTGFLRWAQENI